MTDNAAHLREVIERGFGEGDLSVADRFAGATIVEHEYGAPRTDSGPETLKAQIQEARTQMPDLTMNVEDMVVDGDKVWARSVGRAVHARSRKLLTLTVIDICRFEDGRIAEHWECPIASHCSTN